MTAPWLMWGSDQQITVRTPSSMIGPPQTETFVQTPQIARIDYGRPETWSFFFAAALVGMTPTPTPGFLGSFFLDVYFDVSIGAGRSSIFLREFEHFSWEISNSDPAEMNAIIKRGPVWSQQVVPPAKKQDVPALPSTGIVDSIAAQSINVTARVRGFNENFTAVNTGSFIISAFFAPRSHVRPEWFKEGRFSGGEDYGT